MDVDVTIVGGGVVGVAVAVALAAPHRSVLLIERNVRLGLETSSRNSGVIHAGIYYPPGSQKARFCVAGRDALYRYCSERRIAHARIGKLIVATSEEDEATLLALQERARQNGVDVSLLDADEVKKVEPHVAARTALLSRDTGIVDPLTLIAALWREAQDDGAQLVFGTEVVGLDACQGGFRVTSRPAAIPHAGGTGTAPPRDARPSSAPGTRHTSRIVVNAAGLESDTVAALAGIDLDAAGYRLHYIKGDYFSIARAKASLVSHLIYPVPPIRGHGLGVHLALDLVGRARLGPDAEWIDRRNPTYAIDASKRRHFFEAARGYLPFLEEHDLVPDMSGIRPSLRAPGSMEHDFVVEHETARGLPGLVNLIGIESPGLTACFAIARHVCHELMIAGLLD